MAAPDAQPARIMKTNPMATNESPKTLIPNEFCTWADSTSSSSWRAALESGSLLLFRETAYISYSVNKRNGTPTPTNISALRSSLRSNRDGDTNLKNKFIPKLRPVIHKMDGPFCLLENSAQIAGMYNAPPVTAPMLSTTSTIPPAMGTKNAIPMVPTPNSKVERRAMNIKCLSEELGLMGLYTSLVSTAAARLREVLTELAVAKIIPPNISPIIPTGNTRWHIIK